MPNRTPFVALLVGLALSPALGRGVRADDPAPPVAPPVAPQGPSPAPTSSARALAWRHPGALAARFAEALDAVEETCGVKFERRPRLRVSTAKEVKEILALEWKASGQAQADDATLGMISSVLVAKYDIASHRVHVLPDNVDRITQLLRDDGLASEGVLRVVLAHECTHALDFPRHGWQPKRALRVDEGAQRALDAVVEGHAQFVAVRVARAWGIVADFEKFTRFITAIPPGLDAFQATIARATAAQAEFEYGQGAAFLEAVFAAGGRAALEAVLADPPRSTRQIEHPGEYLAPRTVAELPLEPVLDVLAPATPPPHWTTTTVGVTETALRGVLAELPESERAGVLDGFREAKMRNAAYKASEQVIAAVAIRFETSEQARRWLVVGRRVSERKDASMKQGSVRITESAYEPAAGPGASIEGFVATKQVRAGFAKIHVVSHLFVSGPVAFELIFSNADGVSRAYMDRMVAAMASYVVDPLHPVPRLPAPDAPPMVESPPAPDPLAPVVPPMEGGGGR